MVDKEQTQDSQQAQPGVALETLRKGLGDSLSNLKELISSPVALSKAKKVGTMDLTSGEDELDKFAGESYNPEMHKGKKKKAAKAMGDEEEEDDYEDDEDEDDEDMGKQPMSKSLVREVADEDTEAEIAMDVEPFLKALVKSIDRRFTRLEKSLQHSMELTKAVAQVTSFSAELQKSMEGVVADLSQQPIPRQGVRNATDLNTASRFQKSGSEVKTYDRSQVLSKSLQLLKSQKISLNQASIIEGRANKGLPLGEFEALLLDKE